jgi:hypothetical protein
VEHYSCRNAALSSPALKQALKQALNQALNQALKRALKRLLMMLSMSVPAPAKHVGGQDWQRLLYCQPYIVPRVDVYELTMDDYVLRVAQGSTGSLL